MEVYYANQNIIRRTCTPKTDEVSEPVPLISANHIIVFLHFCEFTPHCEFTPSDQRCSFGCCLLSFLPTVAHCKRRKRIIANPARTNVAISHPS